MSDFTVRALDKFLCFYTSVCVCQVIEKRAVGLHIKTDT